MNGPSLLYDFVNKPGLDAVVGPRLSFTRATSASVRDYAGRIRYVPSGTPRFEGVGLRTNLVTKSQELDQWTQGTNHNTTANAATAPDGTATADKIYSSNGVASNGGTQILTKPVVQQHHVFSIYAKAENYSWIELAMYDGASEGCRAWFDLSNGVVGSVTAIGTGYANRTSGIQDVGGGWYRCWVAATTTALAENRLFVYPTNADSVVSNGNVSGDGIYVWGAQVEDCTYSEATPNTYIRTFGSAVYNYSGLPDDYTSRDSTVSTGLLVEEARTNTCVQSQDISTTWTNGNTTDAVNQAVAPDGSLTADELIENTATSTHTLANTSAGSDPTTSKCISVFVKAATGDRDLLLFLFNNADTAQFLQVQGDVSAGTVTSSAKGADGTITATGMEDYGDGWYRLWISGIIDSLGAGANTLQAQVRMVSSGSSSYTGDGASGLYLWGFQVEAGSFPTSYIPTTTASVTRNAELVSTTDVSWFNSAASSWAWQARGTTNPAGSVRGLAMLHDAATSADRHLRYDAAQPYVQIRNNNVTHTTLDVGTLDTTANTTAAASISVASGLTAYMEGAGPATASIPDVPDVVDTFIVGSYSGSNHYNGYIQKIAYWKEVLPNSELVKLSDGSRPVTITGMPYEDFMRRKRMMLARR